MDLTKVKPVTVEFGKPPEPKKPEIKIVESKATKTTGNYRIPEEVFKSIPQKIEIVGKVDSNEVIEVKTTIDTLVVAKPPRKAKKHQMGTANISMPLVLKELINSVEGYSASAVVSHITAQAFGLNPKTLKPIKK